MPRQLKIRSEIGDRSGKGRYRPAFVDQDDKHVFTNPGGFRRREDAVRLVNDFEEAIVRNRVGDGTNEIKARLAAAADLGPPAPPKSIWFTSRGTGTVAVLCLLWGCAGVLVGWWLL